MTEIEFNALAADGYNRIPLIAETYADLDTPLSIYLKLAHSGPKGGRYSCLLESVVGGERFGRYSFIGLPAKTRLESYGEQTEVIHEGKVVESHTGNPFDFLSTYQKRFKVALRPGMPRFAGGLAGYFAYEAAQHLLDGVKLSDKAFPSGMTPTPDILLLHIDELVVVDNLAGRTYLIVYADPSRPEAYTQARQRLYDFRRQLRSPVTMPYAYASLQTKSRHLIEQNDYLKAVEKAQNVIKKGQLKQVQIGQTISKPYSDSPLSLYRALRSLNPSPYLYYWNFDDFHVVGSSPEILVRQETINTNGTREANVVLRPLAGTRPRGTTPKRDQELAKELLADAKECAEHNMLIEQAHSDLKPICQPETIRTTETRAIERYSHVMHLVSNVQGKLAPNKNVNDILKVCFPAGTLSGSPRNKAMALIDELEPLRRGIYGGATGYLSYSGEMDLAITIRTGIIQNGNLYVQAAAGIVADSDPQKEWEETEAKARAILRAAEHVQYGLDEPI